MGPRDSTEATRRRRNPPPGGQPIAGALESFAAGACLSYDAGARVRAATHALAAAGVGGERPAVSGELRPGLRGQLFTVAAGVQGDAFTGVLTEVGETRAYAVTIACQRRDGPVASRPVSYPSERWEEVGLESEAFNRRFRLLVLAGQDPGWTMELFSPALIAWLTDRAPAGLGFELNEGWLCVLQPGELADADALAGLCDAAAELVGRLRGEALEESDDPDLLRFDANTKRMDAAVARVSWERPPASAADAIAAYRRVAARSPSVLLVALLAATASLVIGGAVGYMLGGPIGLMLTAVAGAASGWALARTVRTERYRFGGSLSYTWVAIHAFNREYARSRGLERVRIARFHHDNRNLPVRGRAESVQVGPIPGTELSGAYVMLSDAPELRAAGAGSMSAADGRPLSADALVAELPAPPDAGVIERLEPPDGYRITAYDRRKVVVWHPIAGNMTRTLAGCDEFRERAGALLAELTSRG